MRALRPPAIMQMGSPGLPSPMPEFSGINSSTYYRESHPRERETRGPEGPGELAKKRTLGYFLGTLFIFIGRAIKARDPDKRACVATRHMLIFSCSDETLSLGLITSADDESSSQLHAPNTDIRRIDTSNDFSFQE